MHYEIQVIVEGTVQQTQDKLTRAEAKKFLNDNLTDLEKNQDLHNKLLDFPTTKKKAVLGNLVNRAYSGRRVMQVRCLPATR